ncbi:OsmC family protein [Endozoicomonadaceae bacterium StTr2]
MKSQTSWKQGMEITAQSESGFDIVMDGNTQAGASPMELVLAGVGGCSSIDVTDILTTMREDFTGCDTEITTERAETAPRVFKKIHVNFIVTGRKLSEKKVAKAVELSMTKYCSVALMLNSSVDISWSHEVREV